MRVKELNASELLKRCRKTHGQYQKPKYQELFRDKQRGNLRDILTLLVLGIKTARLLLWLRNGTWEAN